MCCSLPHSGISGSATPWQCAQHKPWRLGAPAYICSRLNDRNLEQFSQEASMQTKLIDFADDKDSVTYLAQECGGNDTTL
jgi:hypothetical protein